MTSTSEFEDFGFSLINFEDIDKDFDPDYDPHPLDIVSSDTLIENYLRENPPMAKGRNKGRSGKKSRQKQKAVSKAAPKKVVYPYDDHDDWWDTAAFEPAKTNNKAKTAVGFNSGLTAGYGSKCRHYNTVDSGGLNIKGLTFYPSSMNNERKGDDLIPDWGLYLDWGWKHPTWRAENIDWRDYGLPSNYTVAFEAMLEVIERTQRGEKVEIGCIGGHGRTGTALACIAVMLGMTSAEAIKHVRTQYCSHTLETDEQEWFVQWVEAQIKGVEAPAKPERKVATYTAKGPAVCNQFEHFYLWLREAKVCNNKCTYFNTASKGFEKTIPAYLLGDNDVEWHRKEAKLYRKHPKDPKRYKPATSIVTKSGNTTVTTPKKPTVSTLPPKPAKRQDIIVFDYLVPEPRRNEHHHSPNKKTGCICDVCRYLNAGFEAFLEPYDLEEGAERLKQLDQLEQKAESNIRLGKISEAQTQDVPNQIVILTADQGFVDVIVDSKFPKPPEFPGHITGQKKGDYVWVKRDEKGNRERFWAYQSPKSSS